MLGAAFGLTLLHRLNLEGNGFNASSVVGCDAWRDLGLPHPPDEIIRKGFDSLIQYLLSEDKVATNAIRIFVVGESTVRCLCSLTIVYVNTGHRQLICSPHFLVVIACISLPAYVFFHLFSAFFVHYL